MTPAQLSKYQKFFSAHGYVIIEDFFSLAAIAKLRAAAEKLLMSARVDLETSEKFRRHNVREHFIGHVVHQNFTVLRPLPSRTFYASPVFSDPRLHRLMSALLCTSDYYVPILDVAFNLLGQKAQHVHRDFSTILPQSKTPLPTTSVAMAVPLQSSDESSGTLEFWPGTHRLIDKNLRFLDRLDSQVRGRRSIRPYLPEGTLFLRDSRLIHRGMPNPSRNLRPWLASLWVHPLIRFPNKIKMSRSAWMALGKPARTCFQHCEIVKDDLWTPRLPLAPSPMR